LAAISNFPERTWLMILLRQQREHRSARYGGAVGSSALRCLAAAPIISLMSRYPSVDWGAVG
jgi:hypothetical protein